MTQRTRKLLGAIALLVLVTVYSLVMMVVATTVLPQGARWWSLLFYPVAGLGWVPPAMLIVSWMHGGKRE